MRLSVLNFGVGLAVAIGALGAALGAAEITVGAGCTLAHAINAAETDVASGGCDAGSGADLVVLTGDVSMDRAWEDGASGTPVMDSTIVVDGSGFRIRRSDNLAQYRLFTVAEGGDLTLMNVLLQNGRAPGNDGGAVLNQGTLTVENSQFWGNTAGWYGGAVASDGILKVRDSLFFASSTTLNGSRGAAISNGARCPSLCTATIERTLFLENTGHRGGGIFNESTGLLFLTDSEFDGNSVTGGQGGGVYNRGSANVNRCLFRDNFASNGSALDNEGGIATIVNSTFASNTGSYATVRNLNGTVTVKQSTFRGNEASGVDAQASGLRGDRGDTTEVKGSVFEGNTGAPDCDEHVTDLGFNFGCGNPAATNVAVGLSWNGGYTQVVELLPGSEAIDEGGSCGYGVDQRGVERDDPCESGAFEFGECEDEHLANGDFGGPYVKEACEFLFASDVNVSGPLGDLTLRAGSSVTVWDLSVELDASLTIEIDPTLLP